jgi:hypothetical protein
MEQIFFQSFIDVDKWNLARWRATAFFCDLKGSNPPCLGLVFENIEAGRQIFTDWIERLGTTDRFEELRISIIEGEILGDEPGYSIHISSDPLHTENRLRANGQVFEPDCVVLISRMLRMLSPDSPHLRIFKEQVRKHKTYSIFPVSAQLQPQVDCAVDKTEIHFRLTSEITGTDVDAVVFPENYFDHESVN